MYSRSMPRIACFLLLSLALVRPAPAGSKVAVLELPTGALSRDQAAFVTDVLRKEALGALGKGFDILTRENLFVLLKASGVDPAQCEANARWRPGSASGPITSSAARW